MIPASGVLCAFLAANLLMQPYSPTAKDPIDLPRGTSAPFSGTLLPYRLAAEITVRLEQEEARKDLEVKTATSALTAKHTFDMAIVRADLRYEQRMNGDLAVAFKELQGRNDKLENPPWYKSVEFAYLMGGLLAITGITAGAVIAASK